MTTLRATHGRANAASQRRPPMNTISIPYSPRGIMTALHALATACASHAYVERTEFEDIARAAEWTALGNRIADLAMAISAEQARKP